MCGHNIFKVFVVFILFLSVINIYQWGEIIFQSIENILQIIIKYIIDLQSCILKESIQSVESQLSKENLKFENIELKSEDECPKHRYITRMIERSPLIIYIEKFLTQNEIDHLIKLAEPVFRPSTIYNDNGSYSLDQHRTSSSAHINRHQTSIVKCLEKRFAQFQGDIDLDCMEPFQVVKYTDNQQYKPHYDWFSNSQSNLLKNGGQRVTTFFSYLQGNSSMGHTEFIDIRFNKSLHERFCDILICDEKSSEHGIRFRPLYGNTIFWYNMDEYGQVDYLTYHAGHPPGKNTYKIGLNTWTRESTFHPPIMK